MSLCSHWPVGLLVTQQELTVKNYKAPPGPEPLSFREGIVYSCGNSRTG